jgi:hypothetical protein
MRSVILIIVCLLASTAQAQNCRTYYQPQIVEQVIVERPTKFFDKLLQGFMQDVNKLERKVEQAIIASNDALLALGPITDFLRDLRDAQDLATADRLRVLDFLRQASSERRSLIEAFNEAKRERDSMLAEIRGLGDLRQSLRNSILENREARAELRLSMRENLNSTNELIRQWTPFKNLADRMNAWLNSVFISLLWVIGILVLAMLIASIIAAMLAKAWAWLKQLPFKFIDSIVKT